MEMILNATDVRNEWGKFIDNVVHDSPKFVKRNRDRFLSISIQQARILLNGITFKANYMVENDGTITAALDNFDLVVNAEDEISAKKALAKELVEYANDYFRDFKMYYYSPNRQAHFPYVLAVLVQEDLNGVVDLIHA